MPTLSFKVSAQEAAEIRARARDQRQSLSEFLRTRALRKGRCSPVRLKRSTRTGILTVERAPGSAQISLENIRELLADFP
jgi:hypothetical protein